MKRIILWIVSILLIIVSIVIAGYPFISDYVNNLNALDEVVVYEKIAEDLSDNEQDDFLEAARKYNEALAAGGGVITDPFDETINTPDDYYQMLKFENTDVMAAIEIPKIKVNLPIYHGTTNEVLEKGVGHLSTSSLPVGGTGTHAIISGHTGSSNLRLFSDVNQLEIGDVFYITCLNEKMAYQVDNIEVILPTDTDSLQIDPQHDYVTLVTCTPFGINTHRLLVRGTRISIDNADKIVSSEETADSTWNEEYKKAIIAGVALLAAILLLFFLIRFIVRVIKRKNKKHNDRAELNAIDNKK